MSRVLGFVKGNSGALIIGLSIIIGLNFDRIGAGFRFAAYHLSGEAAADRRANEDLRRQLALRQELERINAEKNEQVERVRRANEISLRAAWEEFLSANKKKFSEIEVVKNEKEGDYFCLRTRGWPTRDQISDEFLNWLNGQQVLGQANWHYDDLRKLVLYHDPKITIRNGLPEFDGCESPDKMWRANRYAKRID